MHSSLGDKKRWYIKKTETLCVKYVYLIWSFLYLAGDGLPWWLRGLSVCPQCGRPGFDPWIGKIPWRRKWQPTSVFLPGESQGQRSLVGYSPWVHKELDTTERLNWTEHHIHWTKNTNANFHIQSKIHGLKASKLIKYGTHCNEITHNVVLWST